MADASEPFVPPLYQSSVYTIPDLDALNRLYNDPNAAPDPRLSGKGLNMWIVFMAARSFPISEKGQ